MTNKIVPLNFDRKSRVQLSAEEREVKNLQAISQRQDKVAFEQLYHDYRKRLGTFLFRYLKDTSTVDEVFNDVMMVVWNRADTYNHQSKVSTWIYAIAYRTCLGQLRKAKKHLSVVSDDVDQASKKDTTIETQDLVHKALDSLSTDHRVVMELVYFEGLNYSDISKVMDCPENTVKTRMYHARKKLHSVLTELEKTNEQH